ncbi:sigma 54-interacting transcriptional regulator [Paraliomyxa miuraensis]|uniref:sigma 54-interacting transcriptional regulator n=1 Tax=Paraliomyxa miuraensis TaxID=376150 RepID=UPI00225ABA81|nr:sigma 54-interacting transcriptional regulator [Paraliomyxa miuraensis]MCX4242781.1 sigma 54-dependent Fis family transcriptional regulator [Paraliomyxa miuraensis]
MTATFYAPEHTHRQLRRVMLRVKAGPDAGAQTTVARSRITIGRSAVNDIALTDSSISGTHAEIVLGDTGVQVHDLDSTNGTFVAGVRVRSAWIEPGMVIKLGKTEIELSSANEVQVPISGEDHFGALYGKSPAMREVFAILERVAPTEMSVLVGGETGTGKELVARALHDESRRQQGPFVVLDCGSLPRELAEAAILGHKKGAFTGAVSDRPGCFEEADGGTLFLDEIGELPLDLQPKLLRVLDRREVQRIGESQVRKVDVRVVAATHRDLRMMVGQGSFREDLYFRLSVMTVDLPPLRDRGDDKVMLAERFLEELVRSMSEILPRASFSDAAREALMAEKYQGNVRQLKNIVQRAAHLCRNGVIEPSDLHLGRREDRPVAAASSAASSSDGGGGIDPGLYEQPFKEAKQAMVDEFERAYLGRLLEKTDNNLSRAAAEAGITRYYLRELLKRLGMHKSRDDA